MKIVIKMQGINSVITLVWRFMSAINKYSLGNKFKSQVRKHVKEKKRSQH